MRKQAIKQGNDNTDREVALEALAKSIGPMTGKSDRIVTAIPGLILARLENRVSR